MQFIVEVPDEEVLSNYSTVQEAAEDIKGCLEAGTEFQHVQVTEGE